MIGFFEPDLSSALINGAIAPAAPAAARKLRLVVVILRSYSLLRKLQNALRTSGVGTQFPDGPLFIP
jgi:hypothetical protein